MFKKKSVNRFEFYKISYIFLSNVYHWHGLIKGNAFKFHNARQVLSNSYKIKSQKQSKEGYIKKKKKQKKKLVQN